MTVDEAEKKLADLGVTSKAAKAAPWLSATVKPTAGMAKIEAAAAERKRKLKEDADAQIAKSREHKSRLVAEHKRFKELLREEALERRRQKDRVELTQRRDHRDFVLALGGTLSPLDERQLQDEQEELNSNPDDPVVRIWSEWLDQVETLGAIDRRECAEPLLRNGSAVRSSRYIEVAPRSSVVQCAIEGHEVAHILHPDLAEEREITGDFGTKISVPSELASWRGLLDNCPSWSEQMHAFMKRCLNSYARYANETEAAAITDICSQLTYLQTRHRIVTQ